MDVNVYGILFRDIRMSTFEIRLGTRNEMQIAIFAGKSIGTSETNTL